MRLKIDSYEKILNTIVEGIAIIGDKKLVYWNDAFLHLLGVDACQIDRTWEVLNVFPLNDQELIRELLRTGVNGQEFSLHSTILNRKTGQRKPVLCRLQVVEHDGRKQLCIVLASFHDLEAADPNAMPREVLALKKAFISNVSHELRTPVAIIREAVSLLGDGTLGELNDSQMHFISMAVKNIDRLTNIINHLLDLALFEKNAVDVVLEQVDVHALMEKIHERFIHSAEQKSLLIHWTYDDNLPNLTTDSTKLMYILNNLLKNAIQFSQQDGEIHVRVACTGPMLTITVADTGCGIPACDRDKVFDMFYQVNRVPGPGEGGVGIGLAVVHRLSQMLKGSVELDSVEGKGTMVSVTLPVNYE